MALDDTEGAALARYLTDKATAWARRNREDLTCSFAWTGGRLVGSVAAAAGRTVPGQLGHLLDGAARRVQAGATVATGEDGALAVTTLTPMAHVLYGPEGFAGGALPDGWAWNTGANYEAGAVDAAAALDGDGYGVLLAPGVPGSGSRIQQANLDWRDPAPLEPHALSLRWRMRLATFDPLHHLLTVFLNFDALGLLSLASGGAGGFHFSATSFASPDSDPFALPTDGAAHWYEMIIDAGGAGGVSRARLTVDGDPLVTFEDAGGTPAPAGDFVGAGYQLAFAATTTAAASAPVAVHIDAVTVADGEQGVPA